MFYSFLRIILHFALRVFYGKIEVKGKELIPTKGPLLIASNHPNGFVEPLIIALVLGRPVHFMVRGDVFSKKWLRPILVNSNQIPIYRFRDGFSELKKNTASMKAVYNALDNDAAIIIFVEGGTESVKTLRPFKKGIARMSSEYLEKYDNPNELQILPVGINFISPARWRSRVMLNIAKPIVTKSYFSDQESSNTSIRKIMKDLYQIIKPLVFDVKKENRQDILNHTLELAEGTLNFPILPIIDTKTSNWKLMKSISETIDEMDDIQFIAFAKDIRSIRKNRTSGLRLKQQKFYSLLFGVILIVPAILGFICNFIPVFLAHFTANKVLDEDSLEFVASIKISTGIGYFLIYYLLLSCVAIYFTGIYGSLVLLAIPLGFIFIFWWTYIKTILFKNRFILNNSEKTLLNDTFAKYRFNIN
ncbi:MAG: 1-acyl-sn-glycerol-3-phosphate acyltransferase [Saprospiraceae bacterium]